jgi:hypothetical protein
MIQAVRFGNAAYTDIDCEHGDRCGMNAQLEDKSMAPVN